MRWKILNKNKNQDLIQILLKNRGFKTKKQQQKFLNPPSPYTLTPKFLSINPKEITKAISRIKKAIKNQEKIVIYGDYDTDGVCATAILWEMLYYLKANVAPYIPTREEGYGMKVARIEQLAKERVKLIITVDQGIVAYAAAAKAKELGIDLIITDHHVAGEKKPKALAIIHTTLLAGAGVAWFLAQQIAKAFGKKNIPLDLVTIGTVTDIVPLVGANRSIVKYGLKDVRETKREGLLALYEKASFDREQINTYEIGFQIGPRLNSAGRMDNPMDALRLICTKDKNRASSLANKLEKRNRQRQELLEETLIHARKFWLKQNIKSSLIFIDHESYQEGIVGLVASRLMEEFYRPAVIISRQEKYSKASARSIEEFNIIEAVRACADILGPHGGHKKAAGFTVETAKISQLKEKLVGLADKKLGDLELSPTLKIDTEVDLADLNLKLFQELEKMAPFGEANPTPVFVTRGVKVISARTVGKENKHIKLKVKSSCLPAGREKLKVIFEAIGFGMGNLYSKLSAQKPIDIAYNLILNEWNGRKSLQLRIKDIKSKLWKEV